MGVVYLICDPANDLFKIGVTRSNQSKRLKQLQTGNGTELFLSSYYECDYPFRLETMLHNKFHHCKETGEWYRLDVKEVVNFKKICAELDHTIQIMKDNEFFAKNLK